MAAHPSALSLPPPTNMERLPSIKELHFPYRSPPTHGANVPHNASEHPQQQQPPRHENVGWGRGAPSNASGPQHPSSMAPPPDHARPSQPPTHKNDQAYAQPPHPYAPQQHPHNPAGIPKSRGDASQNSSKRGRSGSTVSASSGRSPHTQYPPPYPQQSPSPFHPVPGAPNSQPAQEPVQQQSPYVPPATTYGYAAPPPQMAGRPSYPAQAPPQHPQSASRPGSQYHPPPPPHDQWQHSQPPPQQPHNQPPQQPYQQQHPPPPHYENFTRTTPIVPATAEPRNAPAPPAPPPTNDQEKVARDGIIEQIVDRCNILLRFASAYGNNAPAGPGAQELRDMTNFADHVVRLLVQLRDLTAPDGKRDALPSSTESEKSRAPKRPWEEMTRDPESAEPFNDENSASTAQQDMEIIRSKRATSSGTSTPGQPKTKYRKRSVRRATPPGKCHSCNIRETPEWRRGPDGARTLCNACGLHYAKLMRKRDKALGADGKPIPIDLQTLRASTASSRGNHEPNGDASQPAPPPQPQPPHQVSPQGGGPMPPYDGRPGAPPQAGMPYPMSGPGAGQRSPTSAAPPPPPPSHAMMQPPPHARHPHDQPAGGPVPPPPWYVPQAEQPSDGSHYGRSTHPRGSPQ